MDDWDPNPDLGTYITPSQMHRRPPRASNLGHNLVPEPAQFPIASTSHSTAAARAASVPGHSLPSTHSLSSSSTRGRGQSSVTRRRLSRRLQNPVPEAVNTVEIPCAFNYDKNTLRDLLLNIVKKLCKSKLHSFTGVFESPSRCSWVLFFSYCPVENAYTNTTVSELIKTTINGAVSNATVEKCGQAEYRGRTCWLVMLTKNCQLPHHFNCKRQGTVKTVVTRKMPPMIYIQPNDSLLIYCKVPAKNESAERIFKIAKLLGSTKIDFSRCVQIEGECWEVGRQALNPQKVPKKKKRSSRKATILS